MALAPWHTLTVTLRGANGVELLDTIGPFRNLGVCMRGGQELEAKAAPAGVSVKWQCVLRGAMWCDPSMPIELRKVQKCRNAL